MRLFVAIEPDPIARQHLVRVQEAVRPCVARASWTCPDNLHITVKFIGEVADGDVPAVLEVLSRAEPCGAIELSAEGIVCFPPGRATQVIAVEFGGPGFDRLAAAAERLDAALAGLGIARERRRYRAHATLARPRGARQLHAALAEATGDLFPGPAFTAEELVLFESRLSPRGAQYLPVGRYPRQ